MTDVRQMSPWGALPRRQPRLGRQGRPRLVTLLALPTLCVLGAAAAYATVFQMP